MILMVHVVVSPCIDTSILGCRFKQCDSPGIIIIVDDVHVSVEVEEHGDNSAGEAAGREGGGHRETETRGTSRQG